MENKNNDIAIIRKENFGRLDTHIRYLEEEWARYKYLVLEHSPDIYFKIRALLNNKHLYPVQLFYDFIDQAMSCELTYEHVLNAASHIYGYYKKSISEVEKEIYLHSLTLVQNDITKLRRLKEFLLSLAIKYHHQYLVESYYF